MLTDNIDELVSRDDVDIVVELMGPVEPARKAILTALEQRKSVVTANKALMASPPVSWHRPPSTPMWTCTSRPRWRVPSRSSVR